MNSVFGRSLRAATSTATTSEGLDPDVGRAGDGGDVAAAPGGSALTYIDVARFTDKPQCNEARQKQYHRQSEKQRSPHEDTLSGRSATGVTSRFRLCRRTRPTSTRSTPRSKSGPTTSLWPSDSVYSEQRGTSRSSWFSSTPSSVLVESDTPSQNWRGRGQSSGCVMRAIARSVGRPSTFEPRSTRIRRRGYRRQGLR